MDDDVEDCPVCMTTFDETSRRPRTLPCGHTLCMPCINGCKEHSQVTCPTCRAAHAVPEVDQFPISYAVEGLIRKLRRERYITEGLTRMLRDAPTVQAAQETAGAAAGAAGDPGLQAVPDSSITNRLEALVTPTLKVEDLRSLTQSARSLLQAGLVFAVHEVEGESRHARISLEDGRLYLHSLQEQPPPPRAVTVQMDEVVSAAPPCKVFLDVAWPGSSPRRVLVRLSPDTPRGRQFILLCTGQRGPCYANTTLWEVGYKGEPGEWVCGGDYECQDGSGGAALLPDLDKGDYWESDDAGAVWGRGCWASNIDDGAVFCINTRDWPGGDRGGVFGEVVEGLEVVQEAAQHRDIKEVTVVDCGVVLWSL